MVKLEKKKLYEEIAEIITEEIREGTYKQGDKLPSIQALSKVYGVGQASIREALNALRVVGLVEIKHGEGTFIKSIEAQSYTPEMALYNKEDIKDLLEVRKVLEVGSVRAAAQNRNAAQLKKINEALLQMELAMKNKEIGDDSDLMFHLAIADASNNKLLKHMLTEVSDKIKIIMKETRQIWLFNESKSIEKLFNEHTEIYEAIESQNINLAEEKMIKHLEEVESVLIEHYKI
ncbi:FadR/GntR family transcriptional regulator [Macrococcus armenti]|uniref:FadR/GntR family transcriptional regulator n=1 Tax=Macrococcus armenti TaxID=2875764 RepID=UPI001CD3209B|nr:FadR/GntR family transcriptional regulator [Macrococcus armenti]UBH11064.1 FadR family transcriptional regulator [Macrococcus armenti]